MHSSARRGATKPVSASLSCSNDAEREKVHQCLPEPNAEHGKAQQMLRIQKIVYPLHCFDRIWSNFLLHYKKMTGRCQVEPAVYRNQDAEMLLQADLNQYCRGKEKQGNPAGLAKWTAEVVVAIVAFGDSQIHLLHYERSLSSLILRLLNSALLSSDPSNYFAEADIPCCMALLQEFPSFISAICTFVSSNVLMWGCWTSPRFMSRGVWMQSLPLSYVQDRDEQSNWLRKKISALPKRLKAFKLSACLDLNARPSWKIADHDNWLY